MFRTNAKFYLILLILTAGWGLTFWLQQAIALAPAVQFIGVPALLVLLLLLAALALERGDH